MARTRSKPSKPAPKQSTPEPAPSSAKALPPSVTNPPKLFVLPQNTSQDARIVTLDNPVSGTPSRYLFCPENGFYEFTRIAAPKQACKSWLITSETSSTDDVSENKDGMQLGSGYLSNSSDLFIATPIDILFLLLPALAPKTARETKQHFLSLDDHLETLCSTSQHWKPLLSHYASLKDMIERKMQILCDTVDAGDETMYRLSQPKLVEILVQKARRMCENGLPASLEEKFIKSALDVPVMSIKREESSISIATTTTSTSTITETETTTISTETDPPTPPLSTPPSIPPLLRLRTALTYLISAYLPPTLHTPTHTLLKSSHNPDFAPLDTHLTLLAKLKSEAAALRSLSDNISRKRGFEDDDGDDEKAAEREEKKRKRDEEERRKRNESRSIKQLKKVDTSGMKKLSAFFTKAPAKKAGA